MNALFGFPGVEEQRKGMKRKRIEMDNQNNLTLAL